MPGPVLGARTVAVKKASGPALTELTYLLVGSNTQIRTNANNAYKQSSTIECYRDWEDSGTGSAGNSRLRR